ncbi:fimbrillin family protein [Bacteroides fragilis]|uniref:fimbrillin family protein n=1 Tax=Bacteroides fragilis TaxID=817 RepID=UPI00202F154F|nr:hypothetical protein [Bacteroides fragilis]
MNNINGMTMKRNIKQTLLAPVVLLLAAAFGMAGCTADDDLSRLPQGSIPLRVGDVTVAGMKPGTRAAGGNASTRAVVSENATGYTGIRKSRFVDGDVLNLTLSNDGGGTNTSVTATLTGGAWVLSEKVYVISGTTTIRATHAGTEVTVGIKPDALEADTYTLAGEKVTFSMKHANAMIDITLPAGSVPAGVTITSISLAANNGTTDETLTTVVEEEADGNHYRTIALPGTPATPGTVKSLTAVINGQSYVATLATPITVEANKKYPVSLTFKENKLTATVGAASLDWGAGETINIVPAGYTRVIRTPEDLAQFAKDVNDDTSGKGARAAIVLQAADLDLSRLKPAAEAGINPLTGTVYTYIGTADDWVPIGNQGAVAFQGKYNGNGHTISNMKKTTVDYGIGFFGHVKNAALTGINLRDGSITVDCNTQDCALFACNVSNSVVSLCSATGTIDVAKAGAAGGFMARVEDGSCITRCSANVKVSNSSYSLSTFVTSLNNSFIVACSSTGDFMPMTGSVSNSGFVNSSTTSTVMGCYFGGATISSSTDFKANANISCYSPAGNGTFGDNTFTYTDCACAGTITLAGVTGSITPATAYAALTASNASLGDVKTLHWSAAEGYTLTEVTRTWYAADVWKDNGTAAPTLDLTYEGFDGLYEGQPANLLAIAGLVAYYVAPVDAGTDIQWGNVDFKTICPKGWHVPTKDEFVAMTGIPADDASHGDNNDAIKAVFPAGGSYWSSTEELDSGAWYFYVNTDGTSYIYAYSKTSSFQVRCVRKK